MLDMQTSRTGYIKGLIVMLLFVLLYVGVRSNFYEARLIREEGIFAYLFCEQPEGPNYCLFGRVHGDPIMRPTEHPAFLYELIRVWGKVGGKFIADPPLPDTEVVPKLRFFFSCFQLFVWLSLLCLLLFVFYDQYSRLVFAAVVMVMISPIAIHNSIELQSDGSPGVVFCGSFALLLLLVSRLKLSPASSGLLLFLGGLIGGLGKQEWSLVIYVAIMLTSVLFVVFRSSLDSNNQKIQRSLIILVLGVTAGNLCSLLYDSYNYLAIFSNESIGAEISGTTMIPASLGEWLEITKSRRGWLMTFTAIYLIIFPFLYIRLKEKSLNPYHVLLLLVGTGLFFGYSITNMHGVYHRYFATALIVLTTSMVSLFPAHVGRVMKAYCGVVMALSMLWAIKYFVYLPIDKVSDEGFVRLKKMAAPDVIIQTSSGHTWNKPDVNFIHSMAPERAEAFVEKYGLEIKGMATSYGDY